MKKNQGKSILVRVSARFELAGVCEGSSSRESTVIKRDRYAFSAFSLD